MHTHVMGCHTVNLLRCAMSWCNRSVACTAPQCVLSPGVCMQFILGAVGFLYPKFSKSGRELLSPYHVFLGRATFIVGLATMAVRNPPQQKTLPVSCAKNRKTLLLRPLWCQFLALWGCSATPEWKHSR